jgi:hypothetical protein
MRIASALYAVVEALEYQAAGSSSYAGASFGQTALAMCDFLRTFPNCV